MKWYVVQVLTQQERRVKKALEDNREAQGMTQLIDKVVLPTENVSEVKRGQQRIVERKLWPSYLLVHMDLTDESWQYVKNTDGVYAFLGGEKPHELSDEEVNDLLRDLESKQSHVTQRHKFEVGDKVKIADGVFVNFVGTITDVYHEKGRLSVLVSIFGRDTRVDDLEFWQVEEYSEEAQQT